MILKKAKFKKVKEWTRKLISDEIHGCDECKKIIDTQNKENRSLEITVFYNDGKDAEHLNFCSWDCVFKHIPKVKTDGFVSLPYLTFDNKRTNLTGVGGFIKALKTNYDNQK